MDQELRKLLNRIEIARKEAQEKLSQSTRRDDEFYPLLVGELLGHICILQSEINQIAKEAA